ncbi:hypothetical protein GGI07_005173 [Coemansia sp. Benny D115]|nr:hypothetical protein GGI07_005173 [Coemansia sp. Benny D115]
MRGFESTLPIQDIEYSSDAKPDSPNASSTTLPVVNSAGPDDTGNYNPENIDRSEGTVLDSSMGIKGLQAKEENAEMRYAYPASQGFRSSALSEASVTNGYADGYIPQASPLYAETGFNNNRFAQTLSKTQSAALGLSAAPASSQQVDDTPSPTSSQPRVMSVNIVLPTIAVQITEDSSKTGLTAVVPIEPVVAVPTANQKPANIDPQAIPAVSSTVTVYKTLTPSSSTDAQTLASSRRSFKQQIIDDALKSLSKIATEKGVGRLATATADTQPTIYGEKINFVELLHQQ